MRTGGKPVIVNILDSIVGLTKDYAESFRDEELRELANRYVMALHAVELIMLDLLPYNPAIEK